ncbi:MAG: hypothetical protein IJP35_00485 [Clostridia bacterium]|nr:hypothetical protein [Clostridia bacterium]
MAGDLQIYAIAANHSAEIARRGGAMSPPVSVMPPPVSWGGRPRPPVVGNTA